ncbi:STAS domain-containing protein [Georgenia thermotolerans]|uniref:STAS domain-containing protein n=1 Tax=Georgenia thermotolerans TaxID=527326 RepID=A0A7J5USN1_9MICO|nr:STAS domain-containing protein [Georgenia thermotolerans]KAE8765465.1 STAS domain-containing protein [Georgenia thermotolerans]
MQNEPGAVALLTSPSRTRLVLSGDADMTLTRELNEAIAEALELGLPVDIDVRNVTFIDSAVLGALGAFARRLTAPPRLIQPPEVVTFVLEITRMGEVLEILDHDPGFPAAPPAAPVDAAVPPVDADTAR